ncbi:3917_t:CDS:1 [Ambispora gerdemannii]|uniref:3917_t:CDS:1 n=1 Tax=Ambispora gerdemannii TaxID=144530 RepID=A0A9N9CI73_9GLOM|nr:3917_t:CDS:1 [Ambispora gerdemannii]
MTQSFNLNFFIRIFLALFATVITIHAAPIPENDNISNVTFSSDNHGDMGQGNAFAIGPNGQAYTSGLNINASSDQFGYSNQRTGSLPTFVFSGVSGKDIMNQNKVL